MGNRERELSQDNFLPIKTETLINVSKYIACKDSPSLLPGFDLNSENWLDPTSSGCLLRSAYFKSSRSRILPRLPSESSGLYCSLKNKGQEFHRLKAEARKPSSMLEGGRESDSLVDFDRWLGQLESRCMNAYVTVYICLDKAV